MIYLYNTLNYYGNKPYDPVLMNHLIELSKTAQKLAPTNPEVYWSIAQSYVWAGDFSSIEKLYLKAISLDPSIPESHLLLLRLSKAIGYMDVYNKALLQAKKDIPGFEFDVKTK